jgi:hypothetical protein
VISLGISDATVATAAKDAGSLFTERLWVSDGIPLAVGFKSCIKVRVRGYQGVGVYSRT